MVAPRATQNRTPLMWGQARSVTTSTIGCFPGNSLAIQVESARERASLVVASRRKTVSRCSVTACVYARVTSSQVLAEIRIVSGAVVDGATMLGGGGVMLAGTTSLGAESRATNCGEPCAMLIRWYVSPSYSRNDAIG